MENKIRPKSNKDQSLSIVVSELKEQLPHREPMIWVHRINRLDAEGGECEVFLGSDAHFMNGNVIRPSAAVEWVAQAYGYLCAYSNRLNPKGQPGQAPSKAYLLSLHKFEFSKQFNELARRAGSLLIQVKRLRDLGAVQSVFGEVKTPSGKTIAAGEVRVYSD